MTDDENRSKAENIANIVNPNPDIILALVKPYEKVDVAGCADVISDIMLPKIAIALQIANIERDWTLKDMYFTP